MNLLKKITRKTFRFYFTYIRPFEIFISKQERYFNIRK